MWWFDGMGWWMVLVAIGNIIFWGGLIALAVWGISRLSRRDGAVVRREPLNIARERYARGEITREQFEQMKRDLES